MNAFLSRSKAVTLAYC